MRQHAGQFLPVDVRHEMDALAGGGEFTERQRHHLRPEIRAADADVDDVGDGMLRAHLLGVGEHGAQGRLDITRRLCYKIRSCVRTCLLGWSRFS